MNLFREADIEAVRASLASSKYATGTSTHGFYHYPARFSPEIARAVIETFSAPNDWILDPFMGGGTTVVEGLALGRRMIGIDINALGHFVAIVRFRQACHQGVGHAICRLAVEGHGVGAKTRASEPAQIRGHVRFRRPGLRGGTTVPPSAVIRPMCAPTPRSVGPRLS